MVAAMFKEKKISLKIETFPNGEDKDLLLHSPIEIRNILQTICAHDTQCALYYDAGRNFFLTMLLEANDKGIWIDPPSRPSQKRNILESKEIVFVGSHNQTKVQFVATDPYPVTYENSEAIFLPLPQQMLRLQRRDCYRLDAWPQRPLKCVLKPVTNQTRIVRVMDISVEGLALEYQEQDFRLIPGNIYPDCEIAIPEVGTLTATLQVKNTFEVSTTAGKTNRRAGCAFVRPNQDTTLPLQRYVAQMQRLSASMSTHR
jgi:c-di-GMP-binding flagellar brake protein YcgR